MPDLLSLLPQGPALSVFLLACLAVGASPGPGMMFAVARAVGQGRLAGIVSVAGLSAASLMWNFAAAFGVAAVIASSSAAYDALRFIGAAYLVYLAFRTVILGGAPPRAGDQGKRTDPLGRLFFQAMMTNLMNPKSVLFYLSFIPQFTDPSRGNVVAQFIVMGIIFNILGNSINLMVSLFFGHIGEWLASHQKVWRMQQWFTASVFVGIAALLLWPIRR